MSTTIPLTYRVDYEIGLDAEDLTPIQVQEISAQQSIFFCHCLFYLLRQAAISEPHDPLFNPLMYLHALEEITMIGEALSDAAYEQVEQLARLSQAEGRRKNCGLHQPASLPRGSDGDGHLGTLITSANRGPRWPQPCHW